MSSSCLKSVVVYNFFIKRTYKEQRKQIRKCTFRSNNNTNDKSYQNSKYDLWRIGTNFASL